MPYPDWLTLMLKGFLKKGSFESKGLTFLFLVRFP